MFDALIMVALGCGLACVVGLGLMMWLISETRHARPDNRVQRKRKG